MPRLRLSSVGLILLVALVLLAGCSVREEISLQPDGSGEATLTVDLHPILVAYVSDLASAMTGVETEHPVFDVTQIAAEIDERPGIELVRAEQRGRGGLTLVTRFNDINAIFAREGAGDVLRFERRGDERVLTMTLGRDAVARFLEYAPEESASMVELLFPPADGSVTREEYREELAWALEEYDRRPAVERALDEARIEVRVSPQGRLVSQRGGEVVDGTVVFTIPVLELLTLRDERIYSLVFAP